MHILGVNVAEQYSANSLAGGAAANHTLGDSHESHDNKKYIFVKAAEAITQYMAVTIGEDGQVHKATKALIDAREKFAVAQVALTSGYYGWVQVKGPCTMLVKASCAADVKLYSSATAGYLDDDNTSQTAVLGVVLDTARGGTDGTASAQLYNEPQTA